MKILSLIIKQAYFDAILRGEKTQEFREVILPPSRNCYNWMKKDSKSSMSMATHDLSSTMPSAFMWATTKTATAHS